MFTEDDPLMLIGFIEWVGLFLFFIFFYFVVHPF